MGYRSTQRYYLTVSIGCWYEVWSDAIRMCKKTSRRSSFVRQRIQIKSDKMKAKYGKATSSEGFHYGKKTLSKKFQCVWEDSYKVIKGLYDLPYQIQTAWRSRSKIKVVHQDTLTALVTAHVSCLSEDRRGSNNILLLQWSYPGLSVLCGNINNHIYSTRSKYWLSWNFST